MQEGFGLDGERPTTSSRLQEGFGLDGDFVTKIATLVASQLAKNEAINHLTQALPTGGNSQISQPPPAALVTEDITTPPIKFDTQVYQNDLNSYYNEKVILKTVPIKYREQAKTLLSLLDKRSNEFTWDAKGDVYIDEVSIPGADFYEILPRLFLKRQPKQLKGFKDVIFKLKSMGLGHFVQQGQNSQKRNQDTGGQGHAEKIQIKEQWWYIGE